MIYSSIHLGPTTDVVLKEDSPVITCIGLGKKPERKPGKELTHPHQHQKHPHQQQQQQHPHQQQQQSRERCSVAMDTLELPWTPRLHQQHQWISPEISPLPWDSTYHTCQRPRPDPHLYSFDFTLPRGTTRERYESLVQELGRGRGGGSGCEQVTPQRVVHSLAHLEMTDTMVSLS